jgi:hypothetical protein
MADQPVAAKIVHTMFTFHVPHGIQLVNWTSHSEFRFLKSDGKNLLKWWKEQLARLEAELPELCEERVVTQCDDCNGHGRTGDNKVCMSCYGSGRKGFRPPGVPEKDEPAPETKRSEPKVQAAPVDAEVLEEARRIVEGRKTGRLQPVTKVESEDDVPSVDENGDVVLPDLPPTKFTE